MNKLLEEVFATRKITTSKKDVVEVHSATSKKQCEFLQRIISENNFSSSVEIGLAYGMSSLAIVEEVAKNKASTP